MLKLSIEVIKIWRDDVRLDSALAECIYRTYPPQELDIFSYASRTEGFWRVKYPLSDTLILLDSVVESVYPTFSRRLSKGDIAHRLSCLVNTTLDDDIRMKSCYTFRPTKIQKEYVSKPLIRVIHTRPYISHAPWLLLNKYSENTFVGLNMLKRSNVSIKKRLEGPHVYYEIVES